MDNQVKNNQANNQATPEEKKRIGVTMFFALALALLLIAIGGWFIAY